MKRCTKCKEEKPATAEYFRPSKGRKGGLRAECRTCLSEYNRAYKAANREKIQERKRVWHAANREERAEYMRAWRTANPEKQRAYHAANREKPEYRNARAEYQRTYAAANREVFRAKNRRRAGRKRNAEGTHTAEDVKRQHAAQKSKCYYCHAKVGDVYHVDHVIPLSRGGSNGPENLVIACPSCNISKRDKLPHEWIQGGRLL